MVAKHGKRLFWTKVKMVDTHLELLDTPFKPNMYGKVTIMTKAINNIGKEQPFAKDIKWNHGGYKYNGIDEVTVEVV